MAAATAARSPEYPVFAVADCSTRARTCRVARPCWTPAAGLCLGFGRPRWPAARPAEPFTLPGNGPDNRPLFGIDVVGEIDKFWGKIGLPTDPVDKRVGKRTPDPPAI